MSATDQTQDTVRHQSASNDVPAVRKDLDIKNRLVAFLMLVPLVIGMLQTSFLRILLCSALMSICFEEYARVSGLVSRGGVRVMLPLFLTGIVLGLSVQYAGFPGLLSAWALSLSVSMIPFFAIRMVQSHRYPRINDPVGMIKDPVGMNDYVDA